MTRMRNTMPEKMKALRDELYWEIDKTQKKIMPKPPSDESAQRASIYRDGWFIGFNECHAIMSEREEKLVEALKFYRLDPHPECDDLARRTLKDLGYD